MGLCSPTLAFSCCGERGLLLAAEILIVAPLAAEHGLSARGLQELRHDGLAAPRHAGSAQAKGSNQCPWHREADS